MSTPFDIIRRPLITEKTAYQSSSLHKYVFEVEPNASRVLVKEAVEKAFGVKVLKVNILNVPAKSGRRARNRRIGIRKSSYKKAIVTLSAEDRIAIFEGVD